MRSRKIFLLCLITLLLAAWTAQAESSKVIVKAKKTYLRAKQSANAKALAMLTEFEPVTRIETEGDWAKVKIADGKEGYVPLSHLSRFPFISVSGTYVNLRSGPSSRDPVLFRLKKRYPLEVLEKEGSRIKVRDFEGTVGWVHEGYVSTEHYVIVRLQWINLREGPGLDENGKPIYPKRFTADKGVVFKVLDERDGWLHVEHSDGDQGWCSGKIVWGYLTE